MALMDLLKVSRSLSEARDRPHRYKLRTGEMPAFGNSGAGAVEQSGAETALVERKTQTVEGPKPMNAETVESSAPARTAFPVGRWTLKGNPFKSSCKPAPRQSVQGELSLDKVKPMRNDLSDSDLELVRRKPARHVDGGNVFAAPANGEARRPSLLMRIKERLFRAKAK